MRFDEILFHIKRGQFVRRSGWPTSCKRIRVVHPFEQPGIDGPDTVWQLTVDGSVAATYDTEEAATAALENNKKEIAKAWEDFEEVKAKIDILSAESQAALLENSKPAIAQDATLRVSAVPAPRKDRINRPMLLMYGSRGSIYPFTLQCEDVLADDWKVA